MTSQVQPRWHEAAIDRVGCEAEQLERRGAKQRMAIRVADVSLGGLKRDEHKGPVLL
jgi:hypothetical protein